jgi:hypothetical protein
VTGLLFLPDLLGLDDPSPAMARTYVALRELDARMQGKNRVPGNTSALSPGRQMLGGELGVEPIFDAGCLLLAALNGHGLALEEPGERIELAAEILLQLTASPLSEMPESATALFHGAGERPQGYGGVGLAAWVYPGRALGQDLAHRLAGELLSACLGESAPPDRDVDEVAREVEAFLVEEVADLSGELLPPESLEEAGLWRPLTSRLSPGRVRYFRKDLEDETAERLEALAAQRPALDRKARALGQAVAEQVEGTLVRCLDRAEPGRLSEAAFLLSEVAGHLDRRQREAERTADEHWKDLEAVDAEVEHVGAEMEELAARFPVLHGGADSHFDWRLTLKLIRSPRRLIGLVLAYRDLGQRGAIYRALLARQMVLAIDVLQHDLLVEVYEEARKRVDAQRAQVTDLTETFGAARRSLYRDGESDDATSCPQETNTSFRLEHSVLTTELIEELYASIRGSIADRMVDFQAQSPLSTWLPVEADPDAVTAACLAYAREQCQTLERLRVDDLVLDSLPDPRQRAEALRVLVSLSSPFLGWDETRLQGEEHRLLCVHTALGTGEGADSPLLEGLDDTVLPGALRGGSGTVRVVATGDAQRVTALTLMQGLPLAALVGLEEYAAAFDKEEADSLNTTATVNLRQAQDDFCSCSKAASHPVLDLDERDEKEDNDEG